ncbi:MAG: class B sortase [Clostridia bacterium]|nr:class B sortase [Clostridia bacterium]
MKNRRLNRKTRARNYFKQQNLWLVGLGLVLLAAVFIFCSFKVGHYVGEHLASRQGADELKKANMDARNTPVPTVAMGDEEGQGPGDGNATSIPFVTAPPQFSGKSILPVVQYPLNKYAHVSERFRKLQQQNKDIIGWLSIENVVDEAVVQRDNEYYLRRDYKGFHNQNGAIFLDENCSLKTRPYAMVLYGHNMKSGAMFGFIRHYETLGYYKNHPFITFDTAYEDGKYVIFGVGTVSTRSYDRDYLDLAKLSASTISWRREAIQTLQNKSIYTSTVDVQPDDQILLLMTCVADETERQVIAARRIRTGETEEMLVERVQRTKKKAY